MTSRDEALLGIDLGTSGVKVARIGLDGTLLGLGQATYPTLVRAGAGAEQDPDAWWAATAAAATMAMASGTGGGAPGVRAVAVVGQGPTTVAADASGRALRPAITWLDQRAGELAAALSARIGVPAWQLGALPHERWLAAHEPAVHEHATWFLSAWDWLTFRLSGEAVRAVPPSSGHPTDVTLRAGGADPGRFGRAVEWGTPVGELTAEAAMSLGIAPGTPVVAGGNDALASFHGAGLRAAGDAIDTGGTSGGFGVYWDAAWDISGTYRAPAPLEGLWLYGGAMNATGKALDWLAGLLAPSADPSHLLDEASRVPAGSPGLVFLPYLAGERAPIFDPHARGVFAGLELSHTRGHLVRAVLEAAAFALRHVAEPIVAAGVRVDSMVASGGTAATRLWSQVKADVTGFPVRVPQVTHTAAMGAAILAAVGVGAWPDAPSAMAAMVRLAETLEPRPALRTRYDELYSIYRDLYPATAPLLHRLATVDAVAPVGPDLEPA